MASNSLMSCGIAAVSPSLLSSSKSNFVSAGVPLPNVGNVGRIRMAGEPRPAYLDVTLDLTHLGLERFQRILRDTKSQSLSSIHCRWAMLAVPGILVPEALGYGNWVKAQEWAAIPGGQATYLGNPVPWGTLPTILAIEFLAIAFVEQQRSMEKDLEKKKCPRDAFDPLGYSKDPKKFKKVKVKEIKCRMQKNRI